MSYAFLVKRDDRVQIEKMTPATIEQIFDLNQSIRDSNGRIGSLEIKSTEFGEAIVETQRAVMLHENNLSTIADELKENLKYYNDVIFEALQKTQNVFSVQLNDEVDKIMKKIIELSASLEVLKTRINLMEDSQSRFYLAPRAGDLIGETRNVLGSPIEKAQAIVQQLQSTGSSSPIGRIVDAISHLTQNADTSEIIKQLHELGTVQKTQQKQLDHLEIVLTQLSDDEPKINRDEFRQAISSLYTIIARLEHRLIEKNNRVGFEENGKK